jgi:phenylalanyl-tRNA synthetase beta chain
MLGDEKLQIVCGGSNVAAGMLVALAKVGAKVQWHGEGELIELKPTAIRGVESAGMICASTEIGLGELFPLKEEKEILDLTGLFR